MGHFLRTLMRQKDADDYLILFFFQVLLFPLNLFTALSWTSFQIFPDVYEIDLTANQVSASPADPS